MYLKLNNILNSVIISGCDFHSDSIIKLKFSIKVHRYFEWISLKDSISLASGLIY